MRCTTGASMSFAMTMDTRREYRAYQARNRSPLWVVGLFTGPIPAGGMRS